MRVIFSEKIGVFPPDYPGRFSFQKLGFFYDPWTAKNNWFFLQKMGVLSIQVFPLTAVDLFSEKLEFFRYAYSH